MDAEQIRSIDVINGTINSVPGTEDPGDAGLSVRFMMQSHFNDVRTREEGRPIFEMREYIYIGVPGDTTSTVFRPVQERDQKRFPRQWLAFQTGKEQTQGTPLTEIAWLTRAQCDELAYFKIQTLEQLASVSDGNAQRYMGLKALREKAERHLETIKSEAPLHKMEAELDKRDEMIRTLQAQMQEMQEYVRSVKPNAEITPPLEVDRSAERADLDA